MLVFEKWNETRVKRLSHGMRRHSGYHEINQNYYNIIIGKCLGRIGRFMGRIPV
ncbi:hypothetical protein Fmac_029284 [Flemingia macrophylla]|uniref:Uncharacterized protein n=1 Tax=Flemingia macrophylla TaxID=520843 RepID=A0ABD1LBE9_9FABA